LGVYVAKEMLLKTPGKKIVKSINYLILFFYERGQFNPCFGDFQALEEFTPLSPQ
jgi:hypothetical protein